MKSKRETAWIALQAAHVQLAEAGLEMVSMDLEQFVSAVLAVYEHLEGPASKAQKAELKLFAGRYLRVQPRLPDPLKGDGPRRFRPPGQA